MSDSDVKTRAVATAMLAAGSCTYCGDTLNPDVGALVVCGVKAMSAASLLPVVSGICFKCYRGKASRWVGMAWLAEVPPGESASGGGS